MKTQPWKFIGLIGLIGLIAGVCCYGQADLRVKNDTDTAPALKIEKASTTTSNLVEAWLGSTLTFSVPYTGLVPLVNGGTGAATAAGARSALGLNEVTTNATVLAFKKALGIDRGSALAFAGSGYVTQAFAFTYSAAPTVVLTETNSAPVAGLTNAIVYATTTTNFIAYKNGGGAINWIAIGAP